MFKNLKLYELVNPSDPYTFYAPNIKIAGIVACQLSMYYGAFEVGNEDNRTPMLFGWNEWIEEQGIDSDFMKKNMEVIGHAYNSFLIGNAEDREATEKMLAKADNPISACLNYQEEQRSSMNDIGSEAYKFAKACFEQHRRNCDADSKATTLGG